MKIIHVAAKTALLSLLNSDEQKKYYCAKVDGKIRELTYVIDKEGDYSIEFLDLTDLDATKIYSASMRYLVAMACKMLYPKLEMRFFYNISRSMFCKVMNPKNFKIGPAFVEKVNKKVQELVKMDLPLERIKVSKEEAIGWYKKQGFKDKIQVIKYRSENFVHLYKAKADGIEYYDYIYSNMVPSTGYLNKFKIKYYAPGFVIQVPRSECNGEIPAFVDEAKFAEALMTTSHWQENNHLDTVANINHFIKQYSPMALINVCEARCNNALAELGQKIANVESPIRLICIAGPSSSGKTSFSNRLVFELMSKGIRPIRISMDDYFLPKDMFIPGTSLESVEAIDIALFNEQMDQLIRGETVVLPVYNFKTHEREEGKKVTLMDNQPIIIEGIHALNSVVCSNIPTTQKYKIYIAPQPQVNIDDHTPISMTDMRLLRRITRDARTRGTDALTTIRMWPSVRDGEFKYIYPTQENADFVFDSFMPYELSAIRNIALPQLDKISPNLSEYLIAMRLKNMIRYFIPIGCADIPCNSIMREFVGGSSFKDAR
ncbi:MAG: hypothetical protein K5762_07690 [Bacilli bacterium]|nr:hypothetical protein [Bacilli bacterium]